jgi:hypothetical protein
MEGIQRGDICEVRSSRNLIIAVYDGNGGFTGIREKFGSRYLFTEYLREGGSGTVAFARVLGKLPSDIAITETEPGATPTCRACGERAWWTGPPAPAPWACDSGCENVTGISPRMNRALFRYLDQFPPPGNLD